jgi:tryptophanyl-tRNA synthetase
MKEERVFSGFQPTGVLHLGNYLGTVKNAVALQESYFCIYAVVDYHALTAQVDYKSLRQDVIDMAADLIACGIDPEQSILFVQSHVPEHTELAWIFNCFTSYGDLTRMTQFKEKAEHAEFVNAGLFDYPVLQAADILLYKASLVPVGEDQLQHLELCRRIARCFNREVGCEVFPEVEPILTPASRIMSLADPNQKMSKSLGERHYLGLMEPESVIYEKVRTAVTDPGLKPGQAMGPGVQNLFRILDFVAEPELVEPLKEEHRAGKLLYERLKGVVYDSLMNAIAPIRARRAELSDAQIKAVLRSGAERARKIAKETLKEVRELLGVGGF